MVSKFKFDISDINNFEYDITRCTRCKGCKWVDHIYMPGVKFGTRCPSEKNYLWDSFSAYGRLANIRSLLEGKLKYTPYLVKSLYACQLCGACEVGCKRNLDLEIQMSLEATRIKMVQDGVGPMPEHKKLAESIAKENNVFGAPHQNRSKGLSKAPKSGKTDIIYFVGCYSSYTRPEIAKATVKVLEASGVSFKLLADEWCCGNPLYTTGQLDAAKRVAEHNIEAIKQSGASTVLVSCAECLRTLKVDYPKMLLKSTKDMGFKVVHLVELVDELIKKGTLKLERRVDLRVAYHDSCSLSRLSEPWIYYEGERGKFGITNPPVPRRRGTYGVYQPPRDILKSIPGLDLTELIRMKENAWCCGAGGGVIEAFKEYARWSAEQRLEEVKEVGAEALVATCPRCKVNFTEATRNTGDNLKVFDISELIAESIK